MIKRALKVGEDTTGLPLSFLRKGTEIAITHADDRFKSDTFRLLGEIEEEAGNTGAALKAYDQALAINPKIGVAKRAAALRKNI